jgi:hypothetical protein
VDCTLDLPSILRVGAMPPAAIVAELESAGLLHAIEA